MTNKNVIEGGLLKEQLKIIAFGFDYLAAGYLEITY